MNRTSQALVLVLGLPMVILSFTQQSWAVVEFAGLSSCESVVQNILAVDAQATENRERNQNERRRAGIAPAFPKASSAHVGTHITPFPTGCGRDSDTIVGFSPRKRDDRSSIRSNSSMEKGMVAQFGIGPDILIWAVVKKKSPSPIDVVTIILPASPPVRFVETVLTRLPEVSKDVVKVFEGDYCTGIKLLNSSLSVSGSVLPDHLLHTASAVANEFGGRRLSSAEIADARKIFWNSINYSRIRIVENADRLGIPKDRAAVFYNTIFDSDKHIAKDRGILIHELVHVWQSLQRDIGGSYIPRSLCEQFDGPEKAYTITDEELNEARSLKDLGIEQQAVLVEYFFRATVLKDPTFAKYGKYGNLAKAVRRSG